MRDDIVFKGVNGGIQLMLDQTADFGDVLHRLRGKLASAAEFFCAGASVRLPESLTAVQRQQIAAVLGEHGLTCEENALVGQGDESTAAPERDGYEIRALVIGRTLRSGQKVVYEGSVVVIGDVNPGAQVIAGQDIIILGACRGLAHAGAYGNESATITANRIVATQLRIAGLIARAPDEQSSPACVETARIKDGTVIIEPANR